MKRAVSWILVLAMALSLTGCDGASVFGFLKPVRQVGETVYGKDFYFTLYSAEFVKRIENGRSVYIYGTDGKKYTDVSDTVATNGYSILKLDVFVGYQGKKKGSLQLQSAMCVDYDNGYEFRPVSWNGKMPTTRDSASGYYNFNSSHDLSVEVKDPLSFQMAARTIYIFVNEEVEDNWDAPLRLKVELPGQFGSKTFSYDLRPRSTHEELKGQMYQKALALITEDTVTAYRDAMEYLEDLGDYLDSRELYTYARLRYSVVGFDGSEEKQYILERIEEFPVLAEAEIQEMMPGSWRLSLAVNEWDFREDGTIDDKWGNKRTWSVAGDKLVMTQTKYTYHYTVYQVYEGGYLLVDEEDTGINAILTMYKE